MQRPVDGAALRAVMRHVPSPVTVVTLAGADGPRGVTIGSFVSVSLDPPLVSFNVRIDGTIHPHLLEAERFNIHILHAGQAALSNRFARPDATSEEQFEGLDYRQEPGMPPVLTDALAVFHCRPFALHPAGDHTLVLAEVEAIDAREEEMVPLLYYRQSYRVPGPEAPPAVNRVSSSTP